MKKGKANMYVLHSWPNRNHLVEKVISEGRFGHIQPAMSGVWVTKYDQVRPI